MRRPSRTKLAGLACTLAAAALILPVSTASATYPGANGRIAFTQQDYLTGDRDIYSVLPRGNGLMRLTSSGDAESPAWSADGRKLAFVRSPRAPGRFAQVFAMNADGRQQFRVTHGRVDHRSPSFAPGGRRIIYSRTRTGHPDALVTVGIDGTDSKVLVRGELRDPIFSPEDRWVAFAGAPQVTAADDGVWLIRRNGSGLHHLAATSGNDVLFEGLDWDPNGSQILAKRVDLEGRSQRILIPVDGSPRKLPPPGAAVFAPSGTLFAGTVAEDNGIGDPQCGDVIAILRSGRYRRVTHNCEQDLDLIASEPTWQPVAVGVRRNP